MSSFFEKLKKGMEIKNLPETKKSPEIEKPLPLEEAPKEPSVVLTPVKTKRRKKKKETKKEEEIKKPSIAEKTQPVLSESPLEEKEEEFKKKKVKVKKEKREIKKPSFAEALNNKEKRWPGPARQSFASQNLGGPEGQLTVDVYQTDKEIVIQSAIAGVEPEDLDISIENDMVTIRGIREKPLEEEEEERNYFYQECYWGPFSKEIILPAEVDSSRTQASIKQGVLTIRIPKIGIKKKRKIAVEEYED